VEAEERCRQRVRDEALAGRLGGLASALLACFLIGLAGGVISYLSYHLFLSYWPGAVWRIFHADFTVVTAVWLAAIILWKLLTWACFLGWIGCLVWLGRLRRELARPREPTP
jgi:hypothetical protein